MNKNEIAKLIDHGILSPLQTDAILIQEIEKAKKCNVASVCIKPYAVKLAAELLKGTDIEVGTVVGFPHGSNTISVKVFETKQAIEDGAQEIDMVVNIGKVLSEDWEYIKIEISAILKECRKANALLKVIFENTYLQDFHKIELCTICSELGVDFVKTSTGFDYYKDADGLIKTKGATEHDCSLMAQIVSKQVQVKAAGGIRDRAKVDALINIGVTRIGTSATEDILNM